jgi:hypothetical protein
MEHLVSERAFPIVTLLAYFASSQPSLVEIMRTAFVETRQAWVAHHVRFLQAMGLATRPDISHGDLVDLIAALGHGIATQYLISPERFGHDLRAAGRLYATGVLSIWCASVVPTGKHADIRALRDVAWPAALATP